MRAYVQEAQQGGDIYLPLVQSAYWFWDRGYDVIRFTCDELGDGKLDRDLLEHPDEMVLRGVVWTPFSR